MAGILHLTLIDPAPRSTTLGPLLRAWLEDYLLLNLERSSRCMNPRRVFPVWLEEAKLRAPGSTIQHNAFRAAAPPGDQDDKTQLRTVAGRMLWKEMWGKYVRTEGKSQSWWWDDIDIVDECVRLGTSWDYTVIDAVKDTTEGL